uniref:Prospero domain-containing protein n=1 Tax=Nothobranchius furzeri TaxID=105023 RepID=A0A8C6L874_NOTFU
MDSPTGLFDDSSPQIHPFSAILSSSDLPVGLPAPAFRPPGFPLIHHLLQPAGVSRRIGGILTANLNAHRHLEDGIGDGDRVTAGQVEQEIEGEEEGAMEGEDNLSEVKKRHSDAALMAEWRQDVLKVKRMKLECQQREKEAEVGSKKREGRRREREELKEQLEEARERLQALQEKVWRAFGEKHLVEKEEMKRKLRNGSDEEMEKESFCLLSASPFDNFHKQKEESQKEREGRTERRKGGELAGVMEGSGLWLDCGGLRGDWLGGIEDEGEEGGQKFAQALKLELGSAVARVIDRVLRLYTEMTDIAPSSPQPAISFDPNGDGLPPHRSEPSDLATPLVVHRPPDTRKAYPFLGPPLSTDLNPSHPNIPLSHPSLPRAPTLPHPPLLPPVQSKDPSSAAFHLSSSSSSSSSSFPAPPPPPPLPLPLLHYSMQQLFSRSLHPQLSHLVPPRKDYLGSDPFLEFSSHPSFPPIPLLGRLEPSLARQGGRDRDRGVRGDGGMRGGGGIDGGELYLSEGLSPCHLKKAKLMFFYTRYPSSNTLKTYFPDVKVSIS